MRDAIMAQLHYTIAFAAAAPLITLAVTALVTTIAYVLFTPSSKARAKHYTQWLEIRADNLEQCVRWYASNSDDGAVARHALAQLNGE